MDLVNNGRGADKKTLKYIEIHVKNWKNQELIMLKIKEVPKLSMGYMMSFWFCLDRYTVTNTKITWAFGS